jgi:hypothetical protein
MDMPSAPCLIKEIIDTQFVPCMTLQEMSRLKRTCKEHNDIIDTENLLKNNDSYALDHIFKNFPYDFRSRVLAHYGLTKKNNEAFTFLWNKEKDLRNNDIVHFNNYPADFSEEFLMELYAKVYSNPKKLQKLRLWQIEWAATLGGDNTFSEFLKRILPGSGFNIWNINIASSKKLLSFVVPKRESKRLRKKIIASVCESQDVDLLLAIMGGYIEPRALRHVFYCSEATLIEALREKNASIEDVPDKKGRSFSYYQRNHVPPSIRNYRSLGD